MLSGSLLDSDFLLLEVLDLRASAILYGEVSDVFGRKPSVFCSPMPCSTQVALAVV